MDFAGNLVGGAINAIAQERANQQNIKEAEKNRQFAAEQAKIQRDATSITSQMAQMKMAGINPASQNSLGVSQGGTAAAGSELAHISPVTGFGNALQQNELLQAQIDNVKADTHKKETDAEGQGIQNSILQTEDAFKKAVQDGAIKALNSSNNRVSFDNSMYDTFNQLFKVDENGKINANSDGSFETNPAVGALYQNYLSVQKSLDEIDSVISKNGADAAFANIETAFKSKTLDERIKSVSLNNSKDEMTLQLDGAQLTIAKTEGDRLAFQLQQDQKYDDAERVVAMFGEVTDGIADVAGAVNGAGVVSAMKRNAGARERNVSNREYDSDVNAAEAVSRNEHRHSQTTLNRKKFYDSEGYNVGRRNYSSNSSIPRRKR